MTAAAGAWSAAFASVGSEEWLTARRLIELSAALFFDAQSWVARAGDAGALVDWIRDVDENGRGWSSTEGRLFRLVAALVDPYPDEDATPAQDPWIAWSEGKPRRVIPVAYFLEMMGSWEGQVSAALVDYMTGGDNRHHLGRWTVTPRT